MKRDEEGSRRAGFQATVFAARARWRDVLGGATQSSQFALSARGSAPLICQGQQETRIHSVPDLRAERLPSSVAGVFAASDPPSSPAVAALAGHGPAKSPLRGGRRCPKRLPVAGTKRGAAQPLLSVLLREGLRHRAEGPGRGAPLSRGLWARRTRARGRADGGSQEAEGAARPRSRPPPGLGRKRGLGGRGCRAPRGPWTAGAGAHPRQG